MNTREYCCYTRPYSEIEGLQLAHTLLLQCQCTAGGHCTGAACPAGRRELHQPGGLPGRQFCPRDAADAVLMRERDRPRAVAGCIDDLHQPYRPLAAVEDEPGEEDSRNLYHLPVLIRKTCCIIQN